MINNYYNFISAHALMLSDRMHCSRKEKKALIPLIERLLGLLNQARREGLLSLDENIPFLEPQHLRDGVQMVVDGVDPEDVVQCLTVGILQGTPRGARLLERLIILGGVYHLQQGSNPKVIRTLFTMYLGPDRDLLEDELPKIPDEDLTNLDKLLKRSQTSPLGLEINSRIPRLEDIQIHRLFRSFSQKDLCRALGFTGDRPAWEKILRNHSSATARDWVQTALEQRHPGDEVLKGIQEKVLEFLQDYGEEAK